MTAADGNGDKAAGDKAAGDKAAEDKAAEDKAAGDKSVTAAAGGSGGAAPSSAIPSGGDRPDPRNVPATTGSGAAGSAAGGVAHGAVPPTTPERHGMFFARDTGDTSGYGGLVRPPYVPTQSERPYGGYFDEIADALADAMTDRQIPPSAIEQVTVANGEMTIYVARAHLVDLLQTLRDDAALRFEMASSVSGVDYGKDVPRRLHVVYELMSMTYRRRVRLEVAVDVDDATVPSAVAIYPTADWHEREVWDMFGVVFAGHPGLTRILMPDDWIGFPQRKDYPLGGIPVEYKGHEVAAPDERRAYT